MPQFNPSLTTRLLLVVLSGLLTYPAIKLDTFLTPDRYPPILSWWMLLHGVVFGALVMAPFVSASNYRGLRIAALIVASAASYYIAIEVASLDDFAILTERVQFMIAGLTGAFLTVAATRHIAPLKVRPAYWLWSAVAGLAGGAVFSFTIEVCFWDRCNAWWHVLPYASGWIAWQGLVCLAMVFGQQQDSAEPSGI